MSSGPVVLFQPPNSVGLGHMNRLAAIALALQDLSPLARVPFVIEGASHSLLESYGLPYMTLPTQEALYHSPQWAPWPVAERRDLFVALARKTLQMLHVDLVTFDCFPNPHFAIAAHEESVPMALVLRKGRDWNSYLADKRVRDLLPNLETIIVPHEPETCELPEFLRGKATYAGEIVRPLPLDPVPLALRLGGGGKCVVITGGGGGYPGTVDFFNLALRAFSEVRKELPELQGVLIAGPLFHDWFKLELVEGMRVTPFEPEADSIFATADLVISQAGYNTIAELAALGTPAICIPAERGFDDQFERAATVAEQFPNVHLFTGANAGELPTMIHKCLEGGGERRRGAGPKGAVKAAECLYSLAIRARS